MLAVTSHQRANEEPNNQNTTLFLSGKRCFFVQIILHKSLVVVEMGMKQGMNELENRAFSI